MKKIYIMLGFILIALLNLTSSFGQTTLDMEFRPRSEYREGFRKPLTDTLNPGLVTLQRTRFNADYKSKILNARLSLEDSRIWGNTDLKNNTTKTAIYEAWFEYLITSGLSLQMGRLPLKYDDSRVFSSPTWGNAGVSHDVMVLKYSNPFIQIHSGFAYNNSKDTVLNVAYAFTPKQNYKMMGYAWLSKQVYKGTTLSLIGILEGFEYKTNYNYVYSRFTYGGNLVHVNDSTAWSATLTAYFQQGKDPNKTYSTGLSDLKSYFFAAKFSYKITEKLLANVGVDFYSGSETTIDADKSNTFNRLYGSVHNFNGSMEYFSTLPTQGLIDYYGGINMKISQKFSLDLTGHMFYFDKDLVYNNVKDEKNIGTEVDLILNYVVSKEIAIQGGYCRYFNSSSTADYYKMHDIELHPQQWAYLMLTVKPQLYKTPPIADSK